MNKTIKGLTILIFMSFHGCGLFVPPVSDISEIAFRRQTGLLGLSYTVSFHNDGKANCECSFYNLDKNKKPNLDFVESICTDLYRKDSSSFVEVKDSSGNIKLNGSFTGKITKEQFEKLAQSLQSNDFFSIVEKVSSDAITDSPPNFIKVIYEGKTKEISDKSIDLSEIKNAIITTADETTWLAKAK